MPARVDATAPDLRGMRTFPVLGQPVAVTDYHAAIDLVQRWARDGRSVRLVEAANTHVLSLARSSAEFGEALSRFDLCLPDGMPLVWCLNRFGHAGLRDRVYGPDFMLKCIRQSPRSEGFRHFFLGGGSELLAELERAIVQAAPEACICGVYAPPFGEWNEAEDRKITAALAESKANLVWVGLGCPKQELWLARVRNLLPPGVYFGVGAAFAFHAGRVPQAPPWMQRCGLEWLYRLAAEPRRLWRRYLIHNALFLWFLAGERVRLLLGGGRN